MTVSQRLRGLTAWSILAATALTLTTAFCAPAQSQEPTTAPATVAAPAAAPAEAAAETPTIADLEKKVKEVTDGINFVWTLVAAFLVFFMQAGFAMVETGFTRAKNACNIMMKNMFDFAAGSLAFWAVGFGLMFGASNGFCGTSGFFFQGLTDDPWFFAFWIFQCVFAATAATIVSGAMAERTRFGSYLIYSIVISAVIYPVMGHWAWGNLFNTDQSTWLTKLGFIDFAGSTVVHSVGGWAALAGAIVLGPRIGKYDSNGKPLPIPGHNIPLAALGVFILWFGWFGFNPGSTTSGTNLSMASIAVNTNLAGAAGAMASLITSWILFKKPDTSMSLNGALAGLVGITAGCANVSPLASVLIGAMAGVIVILSVLAIERAGIDDPVGAVSVHGVCGAFGTLCAGVFDNGGWFNLAKITPQLIGIATAFGWVFVTAFILFKVLSMTVGLRASKAEELEGMDMAEHGNEAYPDFAPHTPGLQIGGAPKAGPGTATVQAGVALAAEV